MNMREHLYGPLMTDVMRRCRERLDVIEVDRLRVKPVVKVTGEFWAQSTEGDGNFRMFEFLEREGAQVIVDPLSTWLMYLLRQEHARVLDRRGLSVPRTGPLVGRLKARAEGRAADAVEAARCTRSATRSTATATTSCAARSATCRTTWSTRRRWPRPRTRSTTAWRAAARGTSRSARTSSTR